MALAAISIAVLLFVLARRQGYSNLQAVASGLILATSYGYFLAGRRCTPELVHCLFAVTALFSSWQVYRARHGRAVWYAVFVLSLSSAWLTGGWAGPAVVFASLTGWLLFQENSRLKKYTLLLLGSVVALVPVAIWIWYVSHYRAQSTTDEASWPTHIWQFIWNHGQRGAAFHQGAGQILIRSLPWSLLLPWGVVHSVGRLRRTGWDGPELFALAWLMASSVVLLVPVDRGASHILLGYPPAALLIGTSLVEVLEKESDEDLWFRFSSGTLALLVVIAPIGLGIANWYKEKSMLGVTVLVPVLCLGLLAYQKARMRTWMHFYGIVVASLILLFLSCDVLVCAFRSVVFLIRNALEKVIATVERDSPTVCVT